MKYAYCTTTTTPSTATSTKRALIMFWPQRAPSSHPTIIIQYRGRRGHDGPRDPTSECTPRCLPDWGRGEGGVRLETYIKQHTHTHTDTHKQRERERAKNKYPSEILAVEFAHTGEDNRLGRHIQTHRECLSRKQRLKRGTDTQTHKSLTRVRYNKAEESQGTHSKQILSLRAHLE